VTQTLLSASGGGAKPDEPQSPEKLGAVFTKRWVVDLILDLAGYTANEDLTEQRVIEPSAGHGAFVVGIVERLLESCRIHDRDIVDAGKALLAFDINSTAVSACRRAVVRTLIENGIEAPTSRKLAQTWVRRADFLKVAPQLQQAHWVIGNPPYVRVEDVDKDAMALYRETWTTMSGRADLYVGFLEAGMSLLEDEGRLAVICADRWMRNRYGASLRAMVEQQFSIDACLVMHDVEAFEERVAAYPAITVIRAGKQSSALVCEAEGSFSASAASRLTAAWVRGPSPVREDHQYRMSWTTGWFREGGSWPAGSPDRLGVLSALETKFPTLEEAGVTVAVGAATGADDIYVTGDTSKIEPERVIPAISAREITSGEIKWTGKHLVNPWEPEGVVSLADYPKMRRYLMRHSFLLKARYVARKQPATWWRTIDRIHPEIASTEKLLIPDLKDRIHPVLDPGHYYPLHNLYYVTSATWDLRVLGGLLLSDVANLFVESYSVRMANGYMRVSAQYLRRVRVPLYQDIDQGTRRALRKAFKERDVGAATLAALSAYGLTTWPSTLPATDD
jgi:methylase of polypeptide subunit release factors